MHVNVHSDSRSSATVGFTLVELVIVVSLMSIMMSLAVPGMRGLIVSSRATSTANELIAAINLARSEAAMRGQRVSACALAAVDGSSCAAGTDVDWHKGWIVFVDNTGQPGVVDTDDLVLRRFSPSQGPSSLLADGAFLSYEPSGMLGAAQVAWELRNTSCTKGSDRDVSVSAVGRPQVSHVECS